MEGRKKPFTEFERTLVINLIQQNAAIIENKKCDSTTSQKKQAVWAEIATEYNASPRISQKVDVIRIKKFWNNLKMKSREAKLKEYKRNCTGAGLAVMESESPMIITKEPNLQPVMKVEENDSIENQKDDDDDNDNDESNYWWHLKNREEMDVVLQNEEDQWQQTPELQNTNIHLKDTPGPSQYSIPEIYKRRRLQSLPNCPTVEKLKIKIMEQDLSYRSKKFEAELDHTQKMQALELKLKEKEVEHKIKMLNLNEEEMKLKIEVLKNNINKYNNTGCRMSSTSIKFRWGLSASDPEQTPVLFVGQPAHLSALSWQDVRCKLEPRITEEVWRRGLSVTSAGDTSELWPRGAAVGLLPPRRSRHTAPSRNHALAKIVKSALRSAAEEYIVLVCRKRDVLASAVAIARSVPQYSARSGSAPLSGPSPPAHRALTVEIYIASDEGDSEDEGIGATEQALADGTLSNDELSTIQDVADAVRLAARITDTPANIMDVDAFIEEACKVAKALDIPEPTIIRGEELAERGMGGIYGVGKAAVKKPALVALSYMAPGATETVAWVGKGIVYDTGGLSIKARASMVGMKGDCGGAAAVLGAFQAMVRASPSINIHAVLCLAENAVGPLSTRPDDIHQLYSGRTVEINNTDAEGRLVLSDGVVYARRDLKADTIVDVATLTGAQGTATGKYHAAIISNKSSLEASCVSAGLVSGDLTHALPFAPELHFTEFCSHVADMKNSVADRNNAQPSCAGLFILAHLGFDWSGRWLHVDMAAPAHCGERATGYGVSLLTVLFGKFTGSKLLKALCPLR